MENRVHAVHGCARHARFSQVRLDEIDFALGQWLTQIIQVAAAEIVRDAHFCAARQQLIRQSRSDKRSATRYQNTFPRPESFRRLHF
jgi:hypothetical protein